MQLSGCQKASIKNKKRYWTLDAQQTPLPEFCIDFWVVNEKQYPFKTDPSNIQSSITVDSTDRSPRCRLQGKRLLSVQAWCFFIANSLPVDTQCCCCFRKKQCFIRFAKMVFLLLGIINICNISLFSRTYSHFDHLKNHPKKVTF